MNLLVLLFVLEFLLFIFFEIFKFCDSVLRICEVMCFCLFLVLVVFDFCWRIIGIELFFDCGFNLFGDGGIWKVEFEIVIFGFIIIGKFSVDVLGFIFISIMFFVFNLVMFCGKG